MLTPINAALQQATGYAGPFQGGQFHEWLGLQPTSVISGAADISQAYGAPERADYMRSLISPMTDVNQQLMAATGYGGPFGSGAFHSWLGGQPASSISGAADIAAAAGQIDRANYMRSLMPATIPAQTMPQPVQAPANPANPVLAEQTGYGGPFGGGQFHDWLVDQPAETVQTAADIAAQYGQQERADYISSLPPLANPVDQALAGATGYRGPFGGGEFHQWLSGQDPMTIFQALGLVSEQPQRQDYIASFLPESVSQPAQPTMAYQPNYSLFYDPQTMAQATMAGIQPGYGEPFYRSTMVPAAMPQQAQPQPPAVPGGTPGEMWTAEGMPTLENPLHAQFFQYRGGEQGYNWYPRPLTGHDSYETQRWLESLRAADY